LGNNAGPGTAGAILVPVAGNTYLSVPILEFGSAGDEQVGAGEARMPWLSGKHNFGDASPLSRFVTGLDEALEDYLGRDEALPGPGTGAVRDPWSEDLFVPHLPARPRSSDARMDELEPARLGPRAHTRGGRGHLPDGGLEQYSDALDALRPAPPLPPLREGGNVLVAPPLFPALRRGDKGGFFEYPRISPGSWSPRVNTASESGPVKRPFSRTSRFAHVTSVAGLLVAARALPARRAFLTRQTKRPSGPVAAQAATHYKKQAE
jgi:hypothetical protein